MLKLPAIKTYDKGVHKLELVHYSVSDTSAVDAFDLTGSVSNLFNFFVSQYLWTPTFIPLPSQDRSEFRTQHIAKQFGVDESKVVYVPVDTELAIRIAIHNQLVKNGITKKDIEDKISKSRHSSVLITHGSLTSFFTVGYPLSLGVVDSICEMFSLDLTVISAGGPLKSHEDSVDKNMMDIHHAVEYERQGQHMNSLTNKEHYPIDLSDDYQFDDLYRCVQEAMGFHSFEYDDQIKSAFSQDDKDTLL